MSYSLNRAQLIGNLTNAPEVRQIPSGQTVATFSIATNQTWTDSSGQRQEKVEFHNVVCWGKLADIASQYLVKGKKVFVEGKLQTRSWEGQDGQKRYRTEIKVDNLIMLDRAGNPNGPGGGANTTGSGFGGGAANNAPTSNQQPKTEPAPAAAQPQVSEAEVTIDDLPF